MSFDLHHAQTSRDEAGASAVEYGLLVAAVAAVIVALVFAIGGTVRNSFDDACGKLKTGASWTPGTTCP